MNREDIAKVCHEANRAYCEAIGDTSQVPYSEAPEWQKESALNGVDGIIHGTIHSPEESHESWMREKTQTGWTYGPTKDAEAKTHPCMVPYAELPSEQRGKDALFHAIVKALAFA